MEFLFLIITFAIWAVAAFTSYWAWRLTKKWPMALRLLILSLGIAFTFTPSGLVGHGVIPVPVSVVLVDTIVRGNSKEFYDLVVIPVGVVGGAVFVISAIIAVIRYLALRKTGHHVA